MNTIEFNSPEQLRERADALRERLAEIDWRADGKGLDEAVDDLRGIASQNWYVAADVWRDSGTQAPEPAFIDAATEEAFELRQQAAKRGVHREIESEPSEPQLRAFDRDTLRAPANEPDAKDAANEPQKPVGNTLEDVDLASVKAARQADRAKAEALLRNTAEQARQTRAIRPQPDRDTPDESAPAAGASREATRPAGRDNEVKVAPVFSKVGYTVPKQVAAQYVAHDGKFLDRKSETVHFEDKGKSLATDSNDRKVISHMVEVAKAKNWGVLELKGTEEFRRQAWIAAQVAGMETRGFSPKAQDLALLEVARQEMRISGADRAADPEPRSNTIEAADGPSPDRSVSVTPAAPAPVATDPASIMKQMQEERAREIQTEARTLAGSHNTTTSAELARKAWVAAELAGVQTVGYEPDERARELLEAARKEIYTGNAAPSVSAARLVMEQNLKGMPASVQERCRAEFDTTVAGGATKSQRRDLPAPRASQQTIQAARRAFFERSAAQATAAPAQPERTKDDPGMEISR